MSDDIKTMRQVIAASIGRHYGAAPANTLPKAQEAIGKAVSEACRAVLNNIDQGIIKEGAARRIAQTLAWAGAELVAHEWNDGHPDRGEAHELRGLWHANNRLRAENTRLREQLTLQALEHENRTFNLLAERHAGLKAELEREHASLQEGAKKSAEYIAKLEEMLAQAQRYIPQGDCDQITIRKADQIMERDGLVPSGLILLNPRSGQRAYLEAGCVRWLDQDAGYFFMRPDQNQGSQLVGVELAARPSSAAEIEGLDRELRQELAEWSKLQKFIPSGPAGAINCRKAEKLLEQPHMRTTGIVLANTETGDRTVIDMSAVRWMGSEEFQKLMHSARPPLTASSIWGRLDASETATDPVRDAAQELLAALKGVLAITEDSIGVAWCHPNGSVAKWDEFPEIEAAQAAIAKTASPATAQEPPEGALAERQPDADGWIVWSGGECPLKDGVSYQLRYRDGAVSPVDMWVTWRKDIVAYRIVEGDSA
jgi:hypothetical protein